MGIAQQYMQNQIAKAYGHDIAYGHICGEDVSIMWLFEIKICKTSFGMIKRLQVRGKSSRILPKKKRTRLRYINRRWVRCEY